MAKSPLPQPTQEQTDWASGEGERFTLKDVEKLQILDTKLVLESPEGAELEIRPAGLLARGITLVVDEMLRLLLFLVILGTAALILLLLLGAGLGMLLFVVLVSFFILSWFYGVIFEQLNDGKTPGKVVTSTKVSSSDGTPVGIMQSIIRNLFRQVDSLFLSIPALMFLGVWPIWGWLFPLGLFGLFFVLFSKDFRRLGDHLAGTIVIHTSEPKVVPYKGSKTPIQVPVPMALEDQKLILAFQDRSEEFSEERKVELAEVLRPLHGVQGEQAVEVCLGYANAIRGAS